MNSSEGLSLESKEAQQWLRRLRIEIGEGVRQIDLREFGDMMGVSHGTAWGWEHDKATPQAEHWFHMALLSRSVQTRSYFLVRALNAVPSMLELIKSLSPEEKRAFCQMVGIEQLLPEEPWDGTERRHAVGDSVRISTTVHPFPNEAPHRKKK